MRAWAKADYLEYAKRHADASVEGVQFRDLGPSEWALVFDTETLTDLSQRFRVGAFEVRKAGVLKHRGLITEPAALTDAELETIDAYAKRRKYRVFTREEFVERIFFPYAYRRRALVVGFNLPFDISRAAIGHGPAKGNKTMRGGFSFELSHNPRRARVQIKRAGPRASFMQFTIPDGRAPERRNREAGGDVAQHRGLKGAITRVGVVATARLRGSRDVVLVSVPRCPSSVRAAHPLSPRPGRQGCRVAGAPP